MKKDIKYIRLIGLMDIDLLPFDEVKQLRITIFLKLGEIETGLNYYKQKKFRFDKIAQATIAKLNYDKKNFKKMLDVVDKRIKRGW